MITFMLSRIFHPNRLAVLTFIILGFFQLGALATHAFDGLHNTINLTEVSKTNAMCGNSDGSVEIAASGGTAPYLFTIDGVNFFPSGTFSGLAPGNYIITVVDNSPTPCSERIPVEILPIGLPFRISNIDPTNPTCFGAADGEIAIIPEGGSSYTFSINGGAPQAAGFFNGLTAGQYEIIVSDGSSTCDLVNTVILDDPDPITVNIISQDDVDCNGNINGSTEIEGVGGTPPFQYSENGLTYSSSGSFTGLAPGFYSVFVQDDNSCIINHNFLIDEPPALSLNQDNLVDVSCNGETNGEIEVSGNGGTGPYEFSIDNVAFSSNGLFQNLSAGTYEIFTRDANNCTASQIFSLTEPNALQSGIASQINTTCSGLPDGSVTLEGLGGTAPYFFSDDGVNQVSNPTFGSLAAGTYTFFVHDSNGCIEPVQVDILLPGNLALDVQTVVDVTCNGESTGLITMEGSGGTAPYMYSVNGSNFTNFNAISGLGAGTYSLAVMDDAGCIATSTTTISEPDPLVLTIDNRVDNVCNGVSEGSLSLSSSGGDPASYEYSFDGGAFSTNNIFNNLAAGVYVVSVQDGSACVESVNVTITEPPALSLTPSNIVPTTCSDTNDGEITLSGSGGTGTLQYSIDGSNFIPNNSFSALAAGTYSFTVSDQENCTESLSVDVPSPTPIAIAFDNLTPLTCPGDTDGSVTVNVSGGTPTYLIALDGGGLQGNNNFTNLIGGPHSVLVQDNNGCQETGAFDIIQPDTLKAVLVDSSNVTCFNGNDGRIQVSGTGGSGVYEFAIAGGAFGSSGSFDNLFAATHTIDIRDNIGCTNTFSLTLTQPPAIQLNIDDQGDPLCAGESTGFIEVSASGGTLPYRFSLNNLGFYSANTFQNLPAGAYTVEVSDTNNCITSQSLTLTEPPAITLAAIKIADVSCFGGSDGAGEAQAIGGSGGFSFNWLPGNITTPAISNLGQGTYTVEVTDNTGCTESADLIINQPAEIFIQTSIDQSILCSGSSTGISSATASGGTGAFTYTWDNGTNGQTLTNVPAGTYTLTVTDQNSCKQTQDVVLDEPDPLSFDLSQEDVSCNGANDGSLDLVVSGGTPNYQYIWNNNPALNTPSLNALSPGVFSVEVRDGNACLKDTSITIIDPAPINLSTSQVDETCTEGNGSATVVASGGTGAFSYLWDTSPAQTTATASGLVAGNYTVTVTDANNCQVNSNFTLTDLEAPVLQLVNTADISCFGQNDGSIEVSASQGTGSYSFTWNTNPIQTGNAINSLRAGTYTVTLDDGRCVVQLPVTITEPQALAASIDDFIVPRCFDTSDGQATVNVSGGTGTYSYIWNTIPIQNSVTASGLIGGSYSVEVQDENNCQVSAAVTLTAPSPMSIQIQAEDARCFGDSTGRATAIVAGGTPPYAYDWSNGTSDSTADLLPSGAYSVEVTDDNGCLVLDIVNISEPTELLVNTAQTDLLCFGATDGTALATASGGTGPYRFNWSNGETSADIIGLAAGDYEVVVSDNINCQVQATVSITSPSEIMISVIDEQNSYCDLANGRLEVAANGGTPGYTYAWNNGQNGPALVNVAGAPIDSLYVVTVRDANDCQVNMDVPFENLGTPTAAFSFGFDPSEPVLLSRGDLQFSNTSTGSDAYEWNFGDGSPNSTLENPRHEFLEEGTYTVSLIAFDPNMACPATFELDIEFILDGRIFVPNAFSPNGDGHNDSFYASGLGIENFEMTIFDQWGRQVRKFADIDEHWDGRGKNGKEADEGIYMYVIKSKLNTGHNFTKSGSITLMR